MTIVDKPTGQLVRAGRWRTGGKGSGPCRVGGLHADREEDSRRWKSRRGQAEWRGEHHLPDGSVLLHGEHKLLKTST